MQQRTLFVALQPHWEASEDVLLTALRANAGELFSALESVKGQIGDENGIPTVIDLRYSRITDDGIEALAGLTELTKFTTSRRMTDAALIHLRGMAKLKQLQLLEMRITGDGLRHLAGMSELTHLQICSCTLTDDALSHLPALPGVTMLNLSGSKGCTDASLEHVARLTSLTDFSLNGAPAVGPGLRYLASLPRLRNLDLGGGHWRITTDADLAHLPTLPTVEDFRLRYTHVTDAGLVHLARLPNVQSLNLEMNEITDAGIRHLAALPHLKWVLLNNTKVTLRGIRELQAARPGMSVSARNCTGEPPREPGIAELIRRPEHREAVPVAQSWARIEAWLAEHLPAALAALRPPVDEADLDALEKQIGQPLPADFRASYRIHDGQTWYNDGEFSPGILLGYALAPIGESDDDTIPSLYEHHVEHEWGELEDFMLDWEFYPPDAMRPAASGPGWVPFFWDSGRNFFGIDLTPGPNGVVGQVIPFGWDDEFRPVLALSFAHFLEDIADELEAGNADVQPPEVADSVFRLKGGFHLRRWAEAKLPTAFQQAVAVPRFVPEDHATPIDDKLAREVVAVLRDFLAAMSEYERRWLAARPIHDYGVSHVAETSTGIVGYSYNGPRPGERPANRVQEVLWNPNAMHDEKSEALEPGKHFAQAVVEKREIWGRFLTPADRPNADCFLQQVPPAYNPAVLTDPNIRQVTPGHVIVTFGEPRKPGTCGVGRQRWHLRQAGERWLIERYELVDDPAKPRKAEFS